MPISGSFSRGCPNPSDALPAPLCSSRVCEEQLNSPRFPPRPTPCKLQPPQLHTHLSTRVLPFLPCLHSRKKKVLFCGFCRRQTNKNNPARPTYATGFYLRGPEPRAHPLRPYGNKHSVTANLLSGKGSHTPLQNTSVFLPQNAVHVSPLHGTARAPDREPSPASSLCSPIPSRPYLFPGLICPHLSPPLSLVPICPHLSSPVLLALSCPHLLAPVPICSPPVLTCPHHSLLSPPLPSVPTCPRLSPPLSPAPNCPQLSVRALACPCLSPSSPSVPT